MAAWALLLMPVYVRVKWSQYSTVYRPRLEVNLERSTKIGRMHEIVVL